MLLQTRKQGVWRLIFFCISCQLGALGEVHGGVRLYKALLRTRLQENETPRLGLGRQGSTVKASVKIWLAQTPGRLLRSPHQASHSPSIYFFIGQTIKVETSDLKGVARLPADSQSS